jgi:hypothetical protein
MHEGFPMTKKQFMATDQFKRECLDLYLEYRSCWKVSYLLQKRHKLKFNEENIRQFLKRMDAIHYGNRRRYSIYDTQING